MVKNTWCFNVLGVIIKWKKKTVWILYKYKEKNSSLKRGNLKICYKLNKEFSTDGVTLSVKARSQFLGE